MNSIKPKNLIKILDEKYYKEKKNKTFLISVLFHENIFIFTDYIYNVLYHFRNYNVLILISCNTIMKELINKLELPEYVKIVTERPNEYPIWMNVNLFDQHLKNYLYCKENSINYDYFLFSASNDVFIKDIELNKIKDRIVDTNKQKIVRNDDEINKFYSDFVNNPNLWFAFRKLIMDKTTFHNMYSNKFIIKCNEMEGLILSKSFCNKFFEYYKNNFYQKNIFKEYCMEEIFPASYLYTFYNYVYKVITLREKWCKYDNLKNIHGLDLYKKCLEENKDLFCIKTIDRDIKNPIRVYLRNYIVNKFL